MLPRVRTEAWSGSSSQETVVRSAAWRFFSLSLFFFFLRPSALVWRCLRPSSSVFVVAVVCAVARAWRCLGVARFSHSLLQFLLNSFSSGRFPQLNKLFFKMRVWLDLADLEDQSDVATDSYELADPAPFKNILSFDQVEEVRVDVDGDVVSEADFEDMDDEGKSLCTKTFNFARSVKLVPAELKSANTYVKIMKKYIKHLLDNVFNEKGPKKKAFREAAQQVFGPDGFVTYVKANFDEFEFYHVEEKFGALAGEGMLVPLQWVGGTKPVFHIYEFGTKETKV